MSSDTTSSLSPPPLTKPSTDCSGRQSVVSTLPRSNKKVSRSCNFLVSSGLLFPSATKVLPTNLLPPQSLAYRNSTICILDLALTRLPPTALFLHHRSHARQSHLRPRGRCHPRCRPSHHRDLKRLISSCYHHRVATHASHRYCGVQPCSRQRVTSM